MSGILHFCGNVLPMKKVYQDTGISSKVIVDLGGDMHFAD